MPALRRDRAATGDEITATLDGRLAASVTPASPSKPASPAEASSS
jgi:antitoxin (DNA-binding transcriptional repressor) of toxin-antitoxin stability system